MTTMVTSPRSSISAGVLLNLVFLVLAIALVASLVVQMAGAWTELRVAGRTGELARTDAVVFSTIQALRANRGEAQTTLQTDDDAKAKVESAPGQNRYNRQGDLEQRVARSGRGDGTARRRDDAPLDRG
jgi:hypothetical protein